MAGVRVLLAGAEAPLTLSQRLALLYRDIIAHSGRGTLHELPLFVGTPHQLADGLEEWFTAEACDGFVLAATHIPGAYEDFVRLVVPELQRRGLFHCDYPGATLCENVGLPAAPAWRLGVP
jgi:alkanesulfonate monooxygenase SsuD/methylene tetrahydromethanopterin reductase-like flavin-dependent oxidoreductase (luciferase family)